EKYFDYKSFTHGEAVAIGMYMITMKSESMGDTKSGTSERIKDILRKYSLPVLVELKDREKVLSAIGLDKKSTGKVIRIILIGCIGESHIKKIDISNIQEYIDFK
ncbi:MAG: 3-dehydroquinate synthase, partial [Clostridium sp.]